MRGKACSNCDNACNNKSGRRQLGRLQVWHPTKYAALLADKMRQHGTQAWLINTGWTGGRCALDSLCASLSQQHVWCAGCMCCPSLATT